MNQKEKTALEGANVLLERIAVALERIAFDLEDDELLNVNVDPMDVDPDDLVEDTPEVQAEVEELQPEVAVFEPEPQTEQVVKELPVSQADIKEFNLTLINAVSRYNEITNTNKGELKIREILANHGIKGLNEVKTKNLLGAIIVDVEALLA